MIEDGIVHIPFCIRKICTRVGLAGGMRWRDRLKDFFRHGRESRGQSEL